MSPTRILIIILCLTALTACASPENEPITADNCPLTEPTWLTHPEDAAVQSEPALAYYFVNEDQSIWASAYWDEDFPLRSGDNGNKMGWFRPAGANLEVTGQRLDADVPLMKADIPCCYPTRFQATGLYFPTEGCWEVHAKADKSELTFVVQVEPEE